MQEDSVPTMAKLRKYIFSLGRKKEGNFHDNITDNNSKIVHKQILLCQTTAEGPARFSRFANSACLPTSQEQQHDLSNCRLSGWSDGQLRGMSAELTSNNKDVAWVDTEWPNGLAISQPFSAVGCL